MSPAIQINNKNTIKQIGIMDVEIFSSYKGQLTKTKPRAWHVLSVVVKVSEQHIEELRRITFKISVLNTQLLRKRKI